MKAPDPPHWSLNSCFGEFCTIWDRLVSLRNSVLNGRIGVFRTIRVHSGPFGCLTKLGAQLAELVQKFVPRSRVGIFGNEHIRSTPCDPKLTFWCIRTI